jgi:hypothetical protein
MYIDRTGALISDEEQLKRAGDLLRVCHDDPITNPIEKIVPETGAIACHILDRERAYAS